MKRKLLKEILPSREANRLKVRVYEVRRDENDEPVGVGYSILSETNSDDWWVNVHPNEIDELVMMLVEAKKAGMKWLLQLRVVGDFKESDLFSIPGMVILDPAEIPDETELRGIPNSELIIAGWLGVEYRAQDKVFLRFARGERVVWLRPKEGGDT